MNLFIFFGRVIICSLNYQSKDNDFDFLLLEDDTKADDIFSIELSSLFNPLENNIVTSQKDLNYVTFLKQYINDYRETVKKENEQQQLYYENMLFEYKKIFNTHVDQILDCNLYFFKTNEYVHKCYIENRRCIHKIRTILIKLDIQNLSELEFELQNYNIKPKLSQQIHEKMDLFKDIILSLKRLRNKLMGCQRKTKFYIELDKFNRSVLEVLEKISLKKILDSIENESYDCIMHKKLFQCFKWNLKQIKHKIRIIYSLYEQYKKNLNIINNYIS